MDIIIKIGFYFFVVFILSLGLSKYIVAVFKEKKTFLQTIMSPFSKFLSWAFHWNLEKPMKAKEYFLSLLGISFLSFLFVFLLLLIQPYLPEHKPSMDIRNAFHTAISFLTNTNFQNYIPEQEVSNLVQMIGFTVQNFLSAGIGIAVLFALMRGFLQKEKENLGNCWKDLSKIILELLLPLSVIFSIILVSCGVVQTFKEKKEIRTLEGEQQEIDIGTVASQVAIKQLGSNGGGYFSSNAAHPFENPTEISNFVEMVGILLIPMALVLAFGKIVGSQKQGYLLFKVMLFLLVIGVTLGVSIETQYQNWEGKETRFGIASSSLWSVLTTATSNGSTNSVLNAYHPYSIFLFMLQMGMGEVIFGGVGVRIIYNASFCSFNGIYSGTDDRKISTISGKENRKRRDENGFMDYFSNAY